MLTLPQSLNNWPLAWSLARTAHFSVQARILPLLAYAINRKKPVSPPNPSEFIKYAYTEIYRLLKQDAENIKNGLYPASVLTPENPLTHWKRTLNVFWDGLSVAQRQKDGQHQDLGKEFQELTEGLPEYYVRNFHFQTDGYFSDHSADIYEHQVEILFGGSADPMRRLLLQLSKEQIKGDGKGLKFLEIGAGTGRLTKFVKLAYPKAQITILEPSEAYLKKAREQLADFTGINFVQGFGEDIAFKKETFDFAYSCFLFHELPMPIRKKVINESLRVLKPNGYLGFVDSLQLGDDPQMNWALTQFPTKTKGFFSKALLSQKI